MDQAERAERLREDLQSLAKLKESSTILDFEPSGLPPDRYTLTFRGKGLGRDPAAQAEVSIVEVHQVEMRMPYTYPEQPPDVRWLSPIVHPNVSFSGFINLGEIGLVWTPTMTLDVLCERLWDVARVAFINREKAVNYSAKNWLEQDCPHELPIDPRPLRDKQAARASNVVRYERRGAGVSLPTATSPGEVLFIDENTPAPKLPPRPLPRRSRRDNDEDVIYIGPE